MVAARCLVQEALSNKTGRRVHRHVSSGYRTRPSSWSAYNAASRHLRVDADGASFRGGFQPGEDAGLAPWPAAVGFEPRIRRMKCVPYQDTPRRNRSLLIAKRCTPNTKGAILASACTRVRRRSCCRQLIRHGGRVGLPLARSRCAKKSANGRAAPRA